MSNGFYWLQLANQFGQLAGSPGQLHVSAFGSGKTLPRIDHYGLYDTYHLASAVAGRLLLSLGLEWGVFRSDWDRWQFVVGNMFYLRMQELCRHAAKRATVRRWVPISYVPYMRQVEIQYPAPAEVVSALIERIDATRPDSFTVFDPWEVSRNACLAFAADELTRRGPDRERDTKRDTSKKNQCPIPNSEDVLALCKKLKRDMRPGMKMIDVVRDFAGGDEEKAQSLRRQANRYRRLWTDSPGDN